MLFRSINFAAPMVRALLAGRKSQTRRLLKAKPGMTLADCTVDAGGGRFELPVNKLLVPYAPGDRLWVRESVRAEEQSDGYDGVRYAADEQWQVIKNCPQAGESWSALFHYRGRGTDRIGNGAPPHPHAALGVSPRRARWLRRGRTRSRGRSSRPRSISPITHTGARCPNGRPRWQRRR